MGKMGHVSDRLLGNRKVKQIQTPWEGLSNSFTLLFEACLLQLCQAMQVHKVATITKTSDAKLWSMLEKHIDQTREFVEICKWL